MKDRSLVLVLILLLLFPLLPSLASTVDLGQGFENVYDIEFSPNGTMLAQGRENGWIEVWDVDASQLVTRFQGHGNYIWTIAWSPNGSYLATGSADRDVNIWNTTNWNMMARLQRHSGTVYDLEFSPNGSFLVSAGVDGKLVVWNTSSWSEHRFFWAAALNTVAYSPDGSRLFVPYGGNPVTVYDAETWAVVDTYPLDAVTVDIEISPDGTWLVATDASAGLVGVYYASNGTHWGNLSAVENFIHSLAFSANSSILAVGGDDTDGVVSLWDVDSWSWISNLSIGSCNVLGLDFSADGDLLGAGICEDARVWISDADSDGYRDSRDDCPIIWGNSTIGLNGCPDLDGDGWPDFMDDFPDDPSEWIDSDSDGVGNNADQCPTEAGSSTQDRVGCPDQDGDGWSDQGDRFPSDPNEWADSDADGIGDNADGCPLEAGTSTRPKIGCPDEDQDGWADANDSFPDNSTEWNDTDEDGFGDNSDACPTIAGGAHTPLGCPDQDGDGYGDTVDDFPGNSTEWNDTDEDGIGDNSDLCPGVWGSSYRGAGRGCPDGDGDGWSDSEDGCPTQWGNSTSPTYGCPDADHDGIDDAHDPFLNDTDNDGLPNQWEEDHGLLNGSDDALGDPDGDGRTNIDEYYAGTDPNVFDEEPGDNVTPGPGSGSNGTGGGDQPLVDPVDAGGFIVSAILAIAGVAWVIIRRRKMPHYLDEINGALDMRGLASVWDEIKRKLDKGRILAQHGVVLKEAVDGRREELEALWDEWDDPDLEAPPEPDWYYENPGW